jgi:hypothetical protein
MAMPSNSSLTTSTAKWVSPERPATPTCPEKRCVCIFVYVYLRKCMHMYVCMYVWTYMHTNVNVHVHTCMCMLCMLKNTCVCVCVCVCKHHLCSYLISFSARTHVWILFIAMFVSECMISSCMPLWCVPVLYHTQNKSITFWCWYAPNIELSTESLLSSNFPNIVRCA